MACPFFMPEKQFVSDWPFPQRLPLGAGWMGTCTAPGHEGRRPSDEELKSGCNLGYAKACSRLPAGRHADAVCVRVAKSAMIDGVVVSKPTTSSMPASFGSAMLNPFDVMPITTSLASMLIFWRYARRA